MIYFKEYKSTPLHLLAQFLQASYDSLKCFPVRGCVEGVRLTPPAAQDLRELPKCLKGLK